MPNNVTNKIVFAAKEAERVFTEVCPNGMFDFGLLVPTPINVYQGDLGRDDEADFKTNWLSWNRANWGTKWNCYSQSCGVDNEKAWIKFDTAWSVPYPIIAAFTNKFGIPFQHFYFDEGENFWGKETWNDEKWGRSGNKIQRASFDKSNEATKAEIYRIIFGKEYEEYSQDEE